MLKRFADSTVVITIATKPDRAALMRTDGPMPVGLAGGHEELGSAFAATTPFQEVVAIGLVTFDRLFESDGTPGAFALGQIGVYRSDKLDEAERIARVIGYITYAAARVVTYGGLSSVLPVLRQRALAHALPAPGLEGLNRDGFATHVDLQTRLAVPGTNVHPTLEALCESCGFTAPAINGSMIEGLFDAERHNEIAGYVQQTAVNIARLHLRYEVLCGALAPEDYMISTHALQAGIAKAIRSRPYLAPFFSDVHVV